MSAPAKRAFRTRWTSPHRSPAFPKAYGKRNRRFPAAHRWAGLWRAFFPSTHRPPLPCGGVYVFPVCTPLLSPATLARCRSLRAHLPTAHPFHGRPGVERARHGRGRRARPSRTARKCRTPVSIARHFGLLAAAVRPHAGHFFVPVAVHISWPRASYLNSVSPAGFYRIPVFGQYSNGGPLCQRVNA